MPLNPSIFVRSILNWPFDMMQSEFFNTRVINKKEVIYHHHLLNKRSEMY